jgi:DNA polymerase (family X)
MVRLDSALHILADIAVLQGRNREALELRSAAGRIAPASAGTTASAAVDAALDRIEAHGEDLEAQAMKELPSELQLLGSDGRFTLRELVDLHRATGGTRLADFRVALSHGALDDVPLAERLRSALPGLQARRRRIPLGRARPQLEALARAWLEACPGLERMEPAGSIRRFDATVGDLELLGAAADPAATLTALARIQECSPLHVGPGRAVLRIDRSEVTIRLVRPDLFGVAWLHLTGSPAHVEALQRRAAGRGLRLELPGDGRPSREFAGCSEEEIYAKLGLPFVPPEMREGAGELDAASRGELPPLVTTDAIRGDLHMHTDWSDGRDPLDDMIRAARLLGYEYVAVTDHSASSMVANGLNAERLARQREAIERAREAYPDITILHGSEVDILPDGRLDFPDPVLERLDIVLASLHDAAGQPPARLTDRYVSAMRHPLVNVVTHPTNRLVPSRPGYELDEERLFTAARETGTFLEIDGAPGHLDMDGPMARRAISAGVMVSIDGDCHRADLLGRHMEFAVGTARRGWVGPVSAVNTRPIADLRTLLARKRRAA